MVNVNCDTLEIQKNFYFIIRKRIETKIFIGSGKHETLF